jgi:hypothetical protein
MPSQGVTESGDDVHVPVHYSLNTRISLLVVLRTGSGSSFVVVVGPHGHFDSRIQVYFV